MSHVITKYYKKPNGSAVINIPKDSGIEFENGEILLMEKQKDKLTFVAVRNLKV